MPNCSKCGAELPTFSFGDISDVCRECKPTKAPRKHPLDGLPVLNVAKSRWLTATNSLLAINCGIFLAMVLTGVSPIEPKTIDLLRWGADFGPYTLGGQYWRVITSSFLHIGILHLAVNMYCLLRLGGAIEKLLGAVTVCGVYLVTGVGAALLSLSWDPMRASAGASGALFGIMGVLISALVLGKLPLEAALRRSMFAYVARLALYNLLIGLMGNIDNMAHLGGLVTGLIVGSFFARSLGHQQDLRAGEQRNALLGTAVVLVLVFIPLTKAKTDAVELGKATQAIEHHDCNSAIPHLQRYVSLRPNDAHAHGMLGYCLQMVNRLDEAEREYEESLSIDPNDAWTQVNMALLNVGRDDAKAVSYFEKSLPKLEPSAKNFKYFAFALKATGRLGEARQELERSISLDPTDAEAHQTLSEILRSQGKIGDAQQAGSAGKVDARAKNSGTTR